MHSLLIAQPYARVEQMELESKLLGQTRQILLYIPDNYLESTLVSYDVIYVFDAQSREMFDLTHALISFIDMEKQFIVVGITSPYFEETDYGRNNDMLPMPVNVDPEDFYGGYHGNADAFLGFVMGEVMAFVDDNYRTSRNRVGIGHSLSASFIINTIFSNPDLFDALIAISPNLAYDKDRVANQFLEFDYNIIDNQKFLYLSHADEGIGYWHEWQPAREKVYSFLENPDNTAGKLFAIIEEFPDYNHWSTFVPAVINGLKQYFVYSDSLPVLLSEELYQVNISVTVPNKDDEVYITGNQPSLSNWQPDKLLMNRESDYTRVITLKLQNPAEIKFTRGSWETQAEVKYNYGFNNINIDPSESSNFEFEIIHWMGENE